MKNREKFSRKLWHDLRHLFYNYIKNFANTLDKNVKNDYIIILYIFYNNYFENFQKNIFNLGNIDNKFHNVSLFFTTS
jgi:hypothetical protein